MRILFCSVPFRPSVGGIETVSALLAERFHRAGHEVVLVTHTPADEPDVEPHRVVRNPNAAALFALVRWADLVFHNNVSLRLGWPLLLLKRPWVVAHHTWIPPGRLGNAKRGLLRAARNIAVSRAIAASLPLRCELVPNPYADDRFRRKPGLVPSGDLVFVGRLVSDKGVAVLLDALALLPARGQQPVLSIIGDGPEREALQRQAAALGLAPRVRFLRSQNGEALVDQLNAHRILVVPSVWEEPFGVVALEGMACGCVPVVARSGGLPDAVGDCGVVFPKGDAHALAQALQALLADTEALEAFRRRMPAHLARHGRDRVARDYLDIIEAAGHAYAAARTA